MDVVRHPLVQEVIRAYDKADAATAEATAAALAKAQGLGKPAVADPVPSEAVGDTPPAEA